jgi:hypothetical protein
VSEVTRSPDARTVSTAPPSDTAVTEIHTMAVARLAPVTAALLPAPRAVLLGGAAEFTRATT